MKFLKHILISFALVSVISSSCTSTYAGSIFKDVSEDSEIYNSINRVFSLGLMVGDLT